MPQTRTGRWTLILAAVAAAWFATFFGLVIGGQRGGDTFFSNPWLAGTITAGTVAAVVAAGVGLVSITRVGERSVAVFVATAFGLLVFAYAVAEIAMPH